MNGDGTKTTKLPPWSLTASFPLKTDRNPIGKYVVFQASFLVKASGLKLQGGSGSFQPCCPQMSFITLMPPKRIWSWSWKKVKCHVWKISYTEATNTKKIAEMNSSTRINFHCHRWSGHTNPPKSCDPQTATRATGDGALPPETTEVCCMFLYLYIITQVEKSTEMCIFMKKWIYMRMYSVDALFAFSFNLTCSIIIDIQMILAILMYLHLSILQINRHILTIPKNDTVWMNKNGKKSCRCLILEKNNSLGLSAVES